MQALNSKKAAVFLGLATLVVPAWGAAPPPVAQYLPHYFVRADLERYAIMRVDTAVERRCGAPVPGWPAEYWALHYNFVWNGESPSPGHRPGSPDEELVIVFVDDFGRVLGVQSRVHNFLLPINAGLIPLDFVDRTHVIVGFAANVHTPGCGALGALIALGVGNSFANGANTSAALVLDQLLTLVRQRILVDGGHNYPTCPVR